MNESKGKASGLIAMFIVVTIYGVSYISREVISGYLPTIAIVGVQMGIMTVLFFLYNLITKKNMKIHKKDILMIIISGLFGTTFFHGLTILSITEIGATVSSLLYGFAAVFALLIEIGFLHRPKTKLGIGSVVISLVGVYILMGVNLQDLASTNFKGYGLCLLSIISWVVYCFLCDRVSNQYEKTVLLSYQALAGAVTTLPFLLVADVSWSSFGMPVVIGNLVILGVFNSTFAYFLNIYAIKKIGVTLSNMFLNFLPVVTIMIALILYGEVPTINQIVGGVIILISVFLLDKDQKNVDQMKANT